MIIVQYDVDYDFICRLENEKKNFFKYPGLWDPEDSNWEINLDLLLGRDYLVVRIFLHLHIIVSPQMPS